MPVPSQRFRAGTTAGLLLAATLLAVPGPARGEDQAAPASPRTDEPVAPAAIYAVARVDTTGPSIGNAIDFGIESVSPAVVRSGVTRSVQVTGHGLADGVDIVLVSGGTYLESVTPLEGSLLIGTAADVLAVGDRAYVAEFRRLHVLDIRDPGHPRQVASVPLASGFLGPGRLTLAEDRLLVPEKGGLEMFDVSSPLSPMSMGLAGTGGECDSRRYPYYTAAANDTAFLVCDPYGGTVWAYDISGPGPAVLIGPVNPYHEPDPGFGAMQGMGGTLFLTDWRRGLVALDVTSPTAPIVLSDGLEPAPHPPYGTYDLVIADGRAFSNGWGNGFLIYDVNDPEAVRRISEQALFIHRPGGLAVQGERALMTVYTLQSPYMVDLSDPARPVLDHQLPSWSPAFPRAFNMAVDLAGNHALQVGAMSVESFNVQHFRRRGILGRVRGAAWARISGNLLVGVDWAETTLSVHDITDPFAPVLLGQAELPEEAGHHDLTVDGREVYLLYYGERYVFDISSPENPAYLGKLQIVDSFLDQQCAEWISGDEQIRNGLMIRHTRLEALADVPPPCQGVVEVLQLDDPTTARFAAKLDDPVRFYDPSDFGRRFLTPLQMDGHQRLFAVEREPGADHFRIRTFDLRDAAHPAMLSSLQVPGIPRAFHVAGDMGYVIIESEAGRELRLVDYSEPSLPVLRGALTRGVSEATRLSASGGLVHAQVFQSSDQAELAAGFFTTLLIDVRSPDEPRLVGGSSSIVASRTGEIQAVGCTYDTCLTELRPSIAGGQALGDGSYRVDLVDAIPLGPYHVVALGADGQMDVLPNAVMAVEDADGDGHSPPEDCDDGDASVHPAAPELPGNAVDENCDGELSCDPGAGWSSHGSFTACVAQACGELVSGGRLSGRECGQAVSAAARP